MHVQLSEYIRNFLPFYSGHVCIWPAPYTYSDLKRNINKAVKKY